MSETVSEAFVAAAGKLSNPPKTKTAKVRTKDGGNYSYKYADLAEMLDAIRPVLASEGLAVMQDTNVDFSGWIGVETRVLHTSGGELRFGPLWVRTTGVPQDTGGAITYARRYALAAVFGIAAEEDNDGKSVDGSTAAPSTAAPNRDEDRGPSASSEGVEARQDAGAYGEDATGSEDTPAPSDARFITGKEANALQKALGGLDAALALAKDRYPDVVHLTDLTFAQARDLVADMGPKVPA